VTVRFRPTRAGVINVWDYVDEEFAFADGRLALRGHNGSGKTKALEVLFPFVLDGVADSRRLDPFSGENRTMKSNLLFRGQESEYGYVWMEFARAPASSAQRASAADEAVAETVTLIIGMRAHRNTDGVRMSFFVTGKRLGVDFGLLSADSRPLTERQLRAVLEREDDVVMGLPRHVLAGRNKDEAAGHAEMHDDDAAILEVEEDVFRAPAHVFDAPAFDALFEARR